MSAREAYCNILYLHVVWLRMLMSAEVWLPNDLQETVHVKLLGNLSFLCLADPFFPFYWNGTSETVRKPVPSHSLQFLCNWVTCHYTYICLNIKSLQGLFHSIFPIRPESRTCKPLCIVRAILYLCYHWNSFEDGW